MAISRKLHIPTAIWTKTQRGTLEMRWAQPAETERKVLVLPRHVSPFQDVIPPIAPQAA